MSYMSYYLHAIELDGLLFSQRDCNLYLRPPDNRNLFSLVAGLIHGQIQPNDLSIYVCCINGYYWTLDHRRLVALKLYKYIAAANSMIMVTVRVRVPPFHQGEVRKLQQPGLGTNGWNGRSLLVFIGTQYGPDGYSLFDTESDASMQFWADWFRSGHWLRMNPY